MMTPGENAADASRPESTTVSSKFRWLFVGVSGALLALLLVSGVLADRFLVKVRAQELAATQALSERAQALTRLWLLVQSYNQAVQQFVTEARAEGQPPSRRQIDHLTVEIDSNLNRYPVDDDSAAALLDGFRDVFLQQQTVYLAVLESKADDQRRRSLMAQQMEPLQKKILACSAKLQSWNEERLKNAGQVQMAEFASAQGGLKRALTIGFGSGFLLALAGMVYIVRLERQTQSRYTQLAQSQRELQRLSARLVDAQETERRSISRELHDEIGQALGALLVDLGRLSTALPEDRPDVRGLVENMKSIAERTFQEVRNISLLLRPSMLDDLGLVAALEWQGREVSRRSDLEVEVESENVADNLPDEYRVCVYRLVQEALNNAVRHSGARHAKVVIRQSPSGLLVQVRDDGRGFDAQRVRGLGLLGMEERVKRLEGKITVESRPDHGVSVTAELPFPSTQGRIS